MIKWQRKDYLSLGKAVANFNKKINELNKEEEKLYLPETLNYKDVKSKIYTRNELNRIINSLKRFSKEGAETPILTKGNQVITKWESQELGKQINIAKRGLKATIKQLEMPFSFGYSKAQMGSVEYREAQANLRSLEKQAELIKPSNLQKGIRKSELYKETLGEIRNLKNLELKQSGEFTRLKERLKKYGSLDYKYMKATIFRENFEKAIEEGGLKNMENYSILEEKLSRIKNPITFYNFISKSNVFMDLFTYYDPKDGLIYGGFTSDEDRFNHGLEELELL